MTEELKIKLSIDKSPVDATLNQIKNQVSNINKSVSSSLSGSTTSDAQAKATDKLAIAMGRVEKSVQNIKSGISGWDIIKAVTGIKIFQDTAEKLQKSTISNIGDNLAENVHKALRALQQKDGDFTILGEEDMIQHKKLEELYQSLRKATNEGNFKGIKELEKTMKGLGVSTKGATAGFKGFATSLVGTAGAIAAATIALAAFVAGVVLFIAAGVRAALTASKLGDEIYHSAQKFGFSTKAYQEWSYIMERNGSTIEDLKGFLETLASEQAAVVNGSTEAAKAFNDLGLSAQQVASMGQEELFTEVVKRLQGINDATKKSAIAYSLFGDEASRLMNVLNMSNADMQKVIDNYHLLGGSMSGDLINKSNSLQNSIANMKQAWQGISNTLAEVFIPIVQKVVQWLTKAFVWLNLFLRVMFGLDLKSSAKDTNGAASSTNKYTGSLKSATAAAKELKRVTMGFDELNIVGDPNKGSSAGNTGGGFDTSGIPSVDSSILDAADLNLDKIYEWFEEYKGVIAQIATWSLIAIGIILAVLGGFGGNIPLLLLGLGMFGLGVSIGFSSGAFEQIGKAIKKWVGDLKAWFKEHVAPIFTKEFWKEKMDKVIEATADWLERTKNKINEKCNAIKAWFKEHIAPIFTKQYWKDKFNQLVLAAAEKLDELGKKIFGDKWNGIKTWFAEHVAPKFTKKYWKDKFESMKQGIAEKVDEIGSKIFKDKWAGIKNWFNTNIAPKFTKQYWKEKFQSIPDGIKGAINGAIGIVEKGINFIIKKINTLSWDVPDWVPAIGGQKWGFNFKTVSIPRLATGGITTGSTIANIGENGREAVLPLENNTQWMDTLADRIAARNSAPTKVALVVDGKELGWATINGINNITEQTGSIQLTL